MYGRGRIVGGIVLLVAIVLGAAAIGYLAYNAGVAEGIAQTAAGEALPGEAGKISPYFYGVRGFGHYGPGSFLLYCLVVPFLFFLFFGAMRLIFAPRRMGGWGRGWGMKGGPWRERAEEWHRQMHEAEDQPEEGKA